MNSTKLSWLCKNKRVTILPGVRVERRYHSHAWMLQPAGSLSYLSIKTGHQLTLICYRELKPCLCGEWRETNIFFYLTWITHVIFVNLKDQIVIELINISSSQHWQTLRSHTVYIVIFLFFSSFFVLNWWPGWWWYEFTERITFIHRIDK